jgi:uncharacterized membrane protein YjgN (DUF898 family)
VGNRVDHRVYRQTPAPSAGKSLLKGSMLQNTLAAVMILLIILGAGVRIWALTNARTILPPDNISSNGTHVCIHYNNMLFFLTSDGQLERRVDLSDIGLNNKPADLQLLSGGDVIIGDFDTGEIMRCGDPDLSCRKIGPAGDYSINENFKFLADEGRNLLYIADTNNHTVLVQDMEGSYIKELEHTSNIKYPNDMALDRSGRLWLSNTFYKSLLPFEINGDSVVETERKIQLRPRITGVEEMADTMEKAPPESIGDLKELFEKIKKANQEKKELGNDLVHIRPLALVWDRGDDLWVVASDPFITTSGVRVFSSEGTQKRRISLGEKAIPMDIDRTDENILITDSGIFQVFSVNVKTGVIGEFGDEDFQGEMALVRNKLRHYEEVKKWAGRSIWLLALGTIVLVLTIVIRNYTARGQTTRTRQAYTPSRAGAPERHPEASEGMQPEGMMRRHRIEFTGSGNEYFRIWIVNTFLTILTFGIYAAWAKVRNRQYFYKNTFLNGHSFDYTANPLAIFKGYVIVGSGLLLYYLSEAFNPVLSLIILGLFSLVIPVLIYKSLRFFTRNSVYRNIRFRFLGTLGGSYRAYLFFPLLVPFTLGLIIPYWAFLKKKYFFHNLAFGTTNNKFNGNPGPFYQVYIIIGLAVFGFIFISMIFMSILMAGFSTVSSPDTGMLSSSIISMMIFIYGMILIIFNFVQQYIYAWATNYCLKHSELGELRFESRLKGGSLFWIRISNIFAIIFSIGLLIPWAKVRRMRYIVSNISLIAGGNLNEFTATGGIYESAYGDAATDFFDFEIGL